VTVLRAALLGLVQGLTEFLPVSSDGHLALFQAAFGEGSLALDVALHAGTLLSMLLFFRSDLVRLLAGLTSRTDDEPRALERRRLLLIVIATVPTGLIGLGLKHTVERLSMSLVAAGLGFLITAAFLLAGERRGRREGGLSLRDIPLWHPVLIGLAQGAAVWPGWSRSASTIGLALVLGWRWDDAGRFSFFGRHAGHFRGHPFDRPGHRGPTARARRRGVPGVLRDRDPVAQNSDAFSRRPPPAAGHQRR
jgi:undecaprenyl-diphosphatase